MDHHLSQSGGLPALPAPCNEKPKGAKLGMMKYASLNDFLNRADLSKGPIAVIFIEDDVEVESTLRHHLKCGFHKVVAVTRGTVPDLPIDIVPTDSSFDATMNALIAKAPGTWMYYCFSGEYLFYPFSEHRTVGEMAAFSLEERRQSILTFVVDLYTTDLDTHPNAVSLEGAALDRSGYYALERKDDQGHSLERQLDFFGGLRWRFEEHIPAPKRRIDRVALFQAKPGLTLRPDHTFNDPEYNTYACPWHHNLTAAICSFRTAKALKSNPGSKAQIDGFTWHNSTPFEWTSQQLLDLGLMEPGQWF